jgi:asparagine synthase (glutamine-hydrolysing)
MCGITTICSADAPVSRHRLVAATEMLRHRGPDGSGYWIDPDERVGLGHARLSIVDLATGQQPMANEDETIHAIVNGEFYDFRRIRCDLLHRGHRLRSQSDSEILLHLYEEDGIACVRHLRGEFAFVLWDARQHVLFAARDRFGIKPLFYAHIGGTLFIASEIKALFVAGVPAAWDREAFYHALFFLPPRDRSLFRDVRQLPPGHALRHANGVTQVQRYWTLSYPDVPSTRCESEQIEQLREQLTEATRLRLDADVPVSCLLSGGVDSSALLGIASRAHDQPIAAFTGVFPMIADDEVRAAEDAAAATRATLQLVPVSRAEMADHLPQAVWHAETLGINLHGVARYLLCRHVHRAGLRVALTGEGADELFGGYIQLRQDASLASHAGAGHLPEVLAPLQARLGFVPAWLQTIAVRQSAFHALLAPEFADAFADADVFAPLVEDADIDQYLKGRDPMLQSMHLWAATILPNYILFAERLEMAHAVEVRLPYLDHEVFELVRTFPPGMLYRGGREKYALREAIRPFVPESIQRRAKQPFLAPALADDIDSPLRLLVQDELHSDAFASLPFFDRDAVLAMEASLPALPPHVRAALDAVLLKIVCASLLQRHFHPAS